ncbi:MAG: hypothetical protein RRZ93_01610 [Ruthenibacterium sp.]
MKMLSFYAFLALGLLLDGAMLFRILLVCAALHEAGHVLAYIFCAHRLPKLTCCASGICLSRTAPLSLACRTGVLCAGPAVNFAACILLYVRAQQCASYGAYLVAAVNLCTGLYNLLPFGALDGAQLMEGLLPARLLPAWTRTQRFLLTAACVVLPLCAWLGAWPMTARVAAVVAPVYLFLQNTLS